MELEGIGAISIDDIRLAADMGYRIKLLGVAQMTGRGLEQRMTPCLVPADSPLGQLQGGTNMVVLEGDSVGQIVLRGPGAGMGPTASAVMSDVHRHRPRPAPADLRPARRTPGRPRKPPQSATPASYYLRMTLLDKPGALAKIATCLGEAGVSIDQMRQYDHEGDQRHRADRHPQGHPRRYRPRHRPFRRRPACWSAPPSRSASKKSDRKIRKVMTQALREPAHVPHLRHTCNHPPQIRPSNAADYLSAARLLAPPSLPPCLPPG